MTTSIGTITATINGNANILDGITATASDTGTSNFTITVNNTASVDQGFDIVAATNSTVDFSAGGITDQLSALVTVGMYIVGNSRRNSLTRNARENFN